MLILDVFQPYHQNVLIEELGNMGIRLNSLPPNIMVERAGSGGIAVAQQVRMTRIDEKHVRDILHLYGVINARVVVREDVSSEQLADHMAGNVVYAKALTVLNKVDLVDDAFAANVADSIRSDFVAVSANSDINIDSLREMIYGKLNFIRIYMRPKGGPTDYEEPLIARSGDTVEDVCNKLHRNMRQDFRYGLVWGKSVKYGGQRVGLSHTLLDEDVLTIIKRR